MDIAKRVRELRQAKYLSQGHISERSGLSCSYISRVECGHATPTIEVLERWSDALGVPIARLFAADRARVVPQRPHTGVLPGKEERRFLALLKHIDEPGRRLWYSLGRAIAKGQQPKG